MEQKDKKDAQILVITLLVLVVVGIVVIGMIILLNRDTSQVALNQKYQQTYSVAETSLNSLIQDYADSSLSLTDLSNDTDLPDGTTISCGSPQSDSIESTVNCTTSIQDSDPDADFLVDLDFVVADSKEVNDFDLSKDDTFILNLGGYTGRINFSWSGTVAMQFQMTYFDDANSNGVWDGNEELFSVNDVYDLSGVFDSLSGDDPINSSPNPNSVHAFNFTAGDANSVEVAVNQIQVRNSSGNFVNLGSSGFRTNTMTIIPRSKVDTEPNAISVSVSPNNPGSFPFQVREFSAVGIDSADSDSPVAQVGAVVPLFSRADSIFNYSLLTKDIIR